MVDDALIVFALLWSALFVFLGCKYSEKRLWWAFADLGWLLFALFGFWSLYNKIPDAQKYANEKSVGRQALFFKQDLHLSLWRIDDRYCSYSASKKATPKIRDTQAICNFVHRSYRELASPIFDNILSTQMNERMQVLCKTGACDSDLQLLKDNLAKYGDYWNSNRNILEKNEFSELKNDVPIYIIGITFFIFAYGFRFGRSIAELLRESKNERTGHPRSSKSG